ncbi:hypothetical protein [Sinorhizobium chiapasense]|uniref:Uncharacterized protein n=1 Tax=Sinorhizobium chiapasense TaxID=501572 RepID=A0ABZ2BKW5_9HYPH
MRKYTNQRKIPLLAQSGLHDPDSIEHAIVIQIWLTETHLTSRPTVLPHVSLTLKDLLPDYRSK